MVKKLLYKKRCATQEKDEEGNEERTHQYTMIRPQHRLWGEPVDLDAGLHLARPAFHVHTIQIVQSKSIQSIVCRYAKHVMLRNTLPPITTASHC